jgi:hypothetical protein
MKNKLEQNRLEARDGIFCIVMETAFDGAASRAGSPAMRQWFRVEEPNAEESRRIG